MVKLTIDMICRGKSGFAKRRREESMEQYLCRLTHLYLGDKNIDEIGDELNQCANLSSLYLYDNKLKCVPVLKKNRYLTHLYLQNNVIEQLSNLGNLRHLVKLYLGQNCITVLEGLENLHELVELHIENQKLPDGEKLIIDQRSIQAVSVSLEVLNISGNNIDSLKEIEPLSKLGTLICRDNLIDDLKEILVTLGKLHSLFSSDFTGNPVCNFNNRYRNRIILVSPRLEILDGKQITATSREFVRGLYANNNVLRKQSSVSQISCSNTGGFIVNKLEIPPMEGPRNFGGYFLPSNKNSSVGSLNKSATSLNVRAHSEVTSVKSETLSSRNEMRKSMYNLRPLAEKSLISLSLEGINTAAFTRYQPYF